MRWARTRTRRFACIPCMAWGIASTCPEPEPPRRRRCRLRTRNRNPSPRDRRCVAPATDDATSRGSHCGCCRCWRPWPSPAGSCGRAHRTRTKQRGRDPCVARDGEPQHRGIAVRHASRDADQQFFSDGLSDNLIDALSRFEGLKVIGRMSSFRFRDGKEGDKAIGDRLGVAYLVAGSVQRADDMVRINASLTRVADGSTLMGGTLRPAVQGPVRAAGRTGPGHRHRAAREAALAEDGARQGERPPSGNIAAYDAYLRGMQAFYRDDTSGIIEYQQLATRLDPGYASAWAQLGIAWTFLGETEGWGTRSRTGTTQGRASRSTPRCGFPRPGRGARRAGQPAVHRWHRLEWRAGGTAPRHLAGPEQRPEPGRPEPGARGHRQAAEAIEHRDRYLSIEPCSRRTTTTMRN